MSFKPLLLLLLLLAALAGCTQSTSPSSQGSVGFAATSDFGYTLNGSAFDRNGHGLGTEAFAILAPNWSFQSQGRVLTIMLRYAPFTFGPYHSTSVSLSIDVTSPVPQTFVINADSGLAIGNVDYDDTNSYSSIYSHSIGQITITKFDTVANVISGTFNFTAAKENGSTPAVTVTSGYFTDVGIYAGSYGQGTISANADNTFFKTQTMYGAVAFIVSGTNDLNIEAIDSTVSGDILLSISQPHIGTFDLSGHTLALPGASYSGSNGTIQMGSANVQGKLTLTQFDTITHRMSGTFQFSGPDQSSGRTIQITNGVIDNVQWFVL
ncbi:MAG: DUF6252 family protein [Candidatus Kapaibacterium sp.]